MSIDTFEQGEVTPDGSPVLLYRLLPGGTDAAVIDGLVPTGASVLDLGSGLGRVTKPLVRRGAAVTWVDESRAMLAHLPPEHAVHSRIQDLRLNRTFDFVLLMSHLINAADEKARLGLLQTCAMHVADTGSVVVQRWHPLWFTNPAEFEGEQDGLHVSLENLDTAEAGVTKFEIRY